MCPKCGRPLYPPADVQGFSVPVRACSCGYVQEPQAVELKLPSLDPGPQTRKVKRLEKDVQQEIVDGLTARNMLVLETSEKRKPVRCPHCSHSFVPIIGRPGVSIGLPDLFVRPNVRAFPAQWIALEVKGTETRVSPAQTALQVSGGVIIVRSWPEALRAVEGEHGGRSGVVVSVEEKWKRSEE